MLWGLARRTARKSRKYHYLPGRTPLRCDPGAPSSTGFGRRRVGRGRGGWRGRGPLGSSAQTTRSSPSLRHVDSAQIRELLVTAAERVSVQKAMPRSIRWFMPRTVSSIGVRGSGRWQNTSCDFTITATGEQRTKRLRFRCANLRPRTPVVGARARPAGPRRGACARGRWS